MKIIPLIFGLLFVSVALSQTQRVGNLIATGNVTTPTVIWTGTVRDLSGSGTPEGVITAPVGSVYRRTNGGTSTTFYVKESGAGNTGWVAFGMATGGTVTSVAETFTGGIISVGGSPITGAGTLALTVVGTSGGVPYFSSGTTWATSALLGSGNIVVGGGAGSPPATKPVSIDASGNTTFGVAGAANVTANVITSNNQTTGTINVTTVNATNITGLTANRLVMTDTAGNVTVVGAGTSGGIPYYGANGIPASSAALGAGNIVLGGGAGVTPATTATASGAVTFIGTPTSANFGSFITDEIGSGNVLFGDQAVSTTSKPTHANVYITTSTLTYGATTDIDFSGDGFKTITLTGAVTFTTSNKAAGKSVTLLITCDGTQRAFTFPAGWIFVGAAAPTALAASKHAVLTLTSSSTTDAAMYCAYSAEP